MKDPTVHPSECIPVDTLSQDGDLICPTFGLQKFETMEDIGLLEAVYQDGDTAIYEVKK